MNGWPCLSSQRSTKKNKYNLPTFLQSHNVPFYLHKVLVLETGKDRYKRTLAFIELLPTKTKGRAIVNAEMIRQGFAWHYKQYNGDLELHQLEQEAREAKRGLWSDSQVPVAPWEWRRSQKAKLSK